MFSKIDQLIFRFINQPTGIEVLDLTCDYIMIFLTYLGDGFIIIPLVGLIIYFIDKKKFKYEFISFVIILLIGGIIIQGLKSLFNTPRPLKILEDVRILLEPLRERGFPSGHTQAIFTASVFLYYKLKRYSLILFGISFLVGLSRIYIGVHFPSDVIGGAIIGTTISLLALHFRDKLFRRYKSKTKIIPAGKKIYKRIGFFHMNQIGDLMFSLPILHATKTNFPESIIYCIVKPHLAELLKFTDYVDEIIIRGYHISSLLRLIKVINKIDLDIMIFFSESISAFIFAQFCNVKEKIGFDSFPLNTILTKKTKRIGPPSIENNKKLGILLGLKNIPKDYIGLLNIKRKNEKYKTDGNIIIVAPFASKRREYKSYPIKLTATLIRLLKRNNYDPILIGDKGNIKKSKMIERLTGVKFQNLVGETSLSQVCDLLIQSQNVICVDTGIMHLAASLGKNIIALFGETIPEIVGPRPFGSHTIIKKQKMNEISPEEIISYLH